jgi:hypothetical protein
MVKTFSASTETKSQHFNLWTTQNFASIADLIKCQWLKTGAEIAEKNIEQNHQWRDF